MNDKWKCGLCSEVNQLLKRKQDDGNEQFSATEKQICEKIVLQMYTHPSSVPFHQPVPADVSQTKEKGNARERLDCLLVYWIS